LRHDSQATVTVRSDIFKGQWCVIRVSDLWVLTYNMQVGGASSTAAAQQVLRRASRVLFVGQMAQTGLNVHARLRQALASFVGQRGWHGQVLSADVHEHRVADLVQACGQGLETPGRHH
jgi:hypothetical protein